MPAHKESFERVVIGYRNDNCNRYSCVTSSSTAARRKAGRETAGRAQPVQTPAQEEVDIVKTEVSYTKENVLLCSNAMPESIEQLHYSCSDDIFDVFSIVDPLSDVDWTSPVSLYDGNTTSSLQATQRLCGNIDRVDIKSYVSKIYTSPDITNSEIIEV